MRSRRRRRHSFASSRLDTGHPVRDARRLDVPRTSACFRYFGGMADKFEGFLPPVYPGYLNYVSREPVGVVGQIVPWNFPLMFTSWKMAPALAGGNTIVIKPSELTPLSTLKIAELMKRVGFPDGRRQCRPGIRPYGGRAHRRTSGRQEDRFYRIDGDRAAHCPGVGLESQEGSTRARRQGTQHRIRRRRHSASVDGSAWAIFHNQGQACIAGSRLILHESIADEFLDRFLTLARSIRLGDPLDERHGNGASHLQAAPGAGAALRQGRQTGRRRSARRRPRPGSRGPRERMLRRADGRSGEGRPTRSARRRFSGRS